MQNKNFSENARMLELSLWSTFQTLAQPSTPSPTLPISPIFPDSTICWSGVHHHNAVAEKAIQTIMSIARTMKILWAIHRPDVSDPSLWPMEVQYGTYLYNKDPDPSTGLCPDDLFTKTRWEHRKFHVLHVQGCPLYVLDKTISDGKKLPLWKPRASQGIFMGLRPDHASTVPMVLTLDTGDITPQFHVVFDDWCTTVATSVDDLPDFNSSA